MRRRALILAAIPLLAACKLGDVLGPFEEDSICWGCYGGDGGYQPEPTVEVSGSVWVGEHHAVDGEVMILLYDPSDLETPVDSIWVGMGGYGVGYGTAPEPAVCSRLARARLWSGETTDAVPLFPSGACVPSIHHVTGPTFQLPAYAPLSEPFVVRGRALVGGAPAEAGQVRVGLQLRPGTEQPGLPFPTDDDGEWRFQTRDGAQRYWLCRRVNAYALLTANDLQQNVTLDLPGAGCGDERHMPDVRFGAMKAAVVVVRHDVAPGVLEPVGAGVASVSLASTADSTVIGDVFVTLDDGQAHVWYPQGTTMPACDLLLRAEMNGRVQFLPLRGPYDSVCYEGQYRAFDFIGS